MVGSRGIWVGLVGSSGWWGRDVGVHGVGRKERWDPGVGGWGGGVQAVGG